MKIFNNKLYFTNWNTNDIKILNLDNYVIEGSIQLMENLSQLRFMKIIYILESSLMMIILMETSL